MIAISLAESTHHYKTSLYNLLTDCVNSGASIGFIAPISKTDTACYWSNVQEHINQNTTYLFIALDEYEVVGAVQLSLSTKANAKHRGEIEKLMVKQSHRKQKIATRLMQAVEKQALDLNLTLLILDTREGDVSEKLYRQLDYINAGVIPKFASNSDATYSGTAIYYKLLTPL